jgi:hypothetical protein
VFVACASGYTVNLLRKGATPAISSKNAPGNGYSPCTFTFNPAWVPAAAPNLNSTLIVRASGCPTAFGGSGDHLLQVNCRVDNLLGGICDDVSSAQFTGFETDAEDPRVFVYNGETFLFYFASGSGQSTVYLRKTSTPSDPSSWTHVAGPLAWHRNGCVIIRADGTHYVVFGESPPLPGLGIATTTDFTAFDVINATFMTPNGPNNTNAPEIVIEAGSTPVTLATGDYLHLYAAGTPGWVANGNYTGGWVILSKDDPAVIVEKSTSHLFVPSMDYEIGNGIYNVNRNRMSDRQTVRGCWKKMAAPHTTFHSTTTPPCAGTIFTTSLVPLPLENSPCAANNVGCYIVWYGAADAVVAWAFIEVLA